MKTTEIIQKALNENLISNIDINMSAFECGFFGIENITDISSLDDVYQNNILQGLRSLFANPKF